MKKELEKGFKKVLKALIDNGFYTWEITSKEEDTIVLEANYTTITLIHQATPAGANDYCINMYFDGPSVDMQSTIGRYNIVLKDIKDYVS